MPHARPKGDVVRLKRKTDPGGSARGSADRGAGDTEHFFDRYDRFLDTSETGPWLERLNARYMALIHANRDLIRDATVLDLGSHDGRFSFAALYNGAAHVIGLEHKPRLVAKSKTNLTELEIAPERFDFREGDMFERLDEIDHRDVVFCFGVFYHITDHMRLLRKLASLQPDWIIFDTNVSRGKKPIIELRPEGMAPNVLVGWPNTAGLDMMVANLGWTIEYFDWDASGLLSGSKLSDYATGRRVTAVVSCSNT